MLSRLLHVHNPTAKQAVITAIDLLGLDLVTHYIVHHLYFEYFFCF